MKEIRVLYIEDEDRQRREITRQLRGKGIASIIGEGKLQGIMRRIETAGAYRGETVLFKKDGQKFPIDLSVSPVFDDDGRTICYVDMGRDITDIKRALDELAQANRELRDTQTQLVQSEKIRCRRRDRSGSLHLLSDNSGPPGRNQSHQ